MQRTFNILKIASINWRSVAKTLRNFEIFAQNIVYNIINNLNGKMGSSRKILNKNKAFIKDHGLLIPYTLGNSTTN